MAAIRRGQRPLNIDLPAPTTDFPPISALFLIYFDIKAGYTIGWKRSLPGIELEGVVEYKSLPSGLHTVKEDLIYFVHDDHAGLSAFVNAPADEESRNARMIAVGVMVPLSYGRLGRSWKHAEKLKEMASELIVDIEKTKILEDFWEEYKPQESPTSKESDSLLDSPSTIKFKNIQTTPGKGHSRIRSASDGAALLSGHNLSAHHPAWSLPNLLDTFGPLIFPIHRAALLRKRILIVSHAPVQETFYDISVLSNIPLAVSDLLSSTSPPQRLHPLFSIGVHDIPFLEEDLRISLATTSTSGPSKSHRNEQGCGWIACTTDSILAMKSALYDVLITMPPIYSSSAVSKIWPKVESPQGMELKASQRDLRRYKSLRWGLSRHISLSTTPEPSARPTSSTSLSNINTNEDTDTETTLLPSSSHSTPPHNTLEIPDTDSIIEAVSWSALAYSGFMWWASAGENTLHSNEESENDASLLSGLQLTLSPSQALPSKTPVSTLGTAQREMAIIAYFHRLTTQILSVISDIIDTLDSDDEREDEGTGLVDGDGEEQGSIWVSSRDVERMGLDVWSANDHAFIEDVAREYFGRRASVEGRNVDICGVRIC
ncbi:hypothetical protein B7494_g4094 [Chlorociboria aeruginascens]|nr:hypothetical protein B7494_g4094 [Chlorociboria aeruginascens]